MNADVNRKQWDTKCIWKEIYSAVSKLSFGVVSLMQTRKKIQQRFIIHLKLMFTDSNCCPWLKSSNIWCEKYRVYCEVSSLHWLCSESLKGLQWCLEVESSVQHPSWWNWISEVEDLKCSFILTKEQFEDFNRKSLEGCSKNQRITSNAVWADNRKAHLDNETQVQ